MKLKKNYVTNANEMQNVMTPINTKKTPIEKKDKKNQKELWYTKLSSSKKESKHPTRPEGEKTQLDQEA